MPLLLNALSRAAFPALVATAAIASPSSASAAAPAGGVAVGPAAPGSLAPAAVTPLATAASLPAVPASGRLSRIIERDVTIASGRTVVVRGKATTVPVIVELRVGHTGRLIASDHVSPKSRFRLSGTAKAGEHLRLLTRRADGGSETSDVRVGKVVQLRATLASWYGGGGTTACGQTLTSTLKGVAHKSLPCGTKLSVSFRGRTTQATVVDRGPFVGNREFDLTAATARALRFDGVGKVWVSR
jgi:rare lipoprotein A